MNIKSITIHFRVFGNFVFLINYLILIHTNQCYFNFIKKYLFILRKENQSFSRRKGKTTLEICKVDVIYLHLIKLL